MNATATSLSAEAARTMLAAGFAAGSLVLPVLPHVASRVMTLANDADADVADLSDLIHQDQSLAGNVLRIANSAAYCAGEPIVSLRQAVMRLGMAVLSEIAVAACLRGQALRTPGYDDYRESLLHHAFLAGGFAKELARRKRRNVETLFLCGLLHSVGKPVVLHLVSELQRGHGTRLSPAEAAGLVDEFHCDAARAVTVAWKLPQQVQIAAVHHADPAGAPAFVEEARLTALGAALAAWVLSADGAEEGPVRELPAWAELNFYPDDVDAVLERRAALEASATAFLT